MERWWHCVGFLSLITKKAQLIDSFLLHLHLHVLFSIHLFLQLPDLFCHQLDLSSYIFLWEFSGSLILKLEHEVCMHSYL